MKQQLIFDTANVGLDDNDNVGAYIRSSDGTLITHTTIGTKQHLDTSAAMHDGSGNALTSTVVGTAQALDVNMVNSISVDLDGIYTGTNSDPDNVGIVMHSRAATLDDTVQVERTTAGSVANIAVAGVANINAQDVNAFAYAVNPTGGMDLMKVDATGALEVAVQNDVVVSDLADTAIQSSSVTLTAAGTAQQVTPTPLANRKFLWLHNHSRRKIYIGDSTVSSSTGFPLHSHVSLELRLGPAVQIYFTGSQNGQDLRVLELA